MTKFQAVRGTHDILPPESGRFQLLEAQARQLFDRFGYHEIRTPTFEALDLFHRTIGEATDIVEKEMYAFEDRGGRKLALRPEGTAGVARAYVEHHLSQTSPFCKLFYIGPMFRAERPQAGRYREFWQIGAEFFGNPAPEADAELLIMVESLFKQLHVSPIELKLNSLGDEKCRPAYRTALVKFLTAEKPRLCEDCQRRMEKNPLRVLDCKIDGPKLTNLPTMDQFWCEDCRTHFETVCRLVEKAGGRFKRTPRLVRGLDYYTRTVFEVTTTSLGAQDALAAGGRYDKLVKQLDGPDVPALGFALGSERTLAAMKASASPALAKNGTVSIFVAALGDEAIPEAFGLLQELRASPELLQKGVGIEGGFFQKKLGAQLTIADRIGATHCVIIGDEELQKGEVTLRSLKESAQQRLSKKDLLSHLLKLRA